VSHAVGCVIIAFIIGRGQKMATRRMKGGKNSELVGDGRDWLMTEGEHGITLGTGYLTVPTKVPRYQVPKPGQKGVDPPVPPWFLPGTFTLSIRDGVMKSRQRKSDLGD